MSNTEKARHLAVVPKISTQPSGLTRGQVAARLNISVSTVRRFEGSRLNPTIGADDVRRFDEKEVVALAAELANAAVMKVKATSGAPAPTSASRDPGELAALAFERLEQRQSLAELVIGLRITPEIARAFFDQWSVGLAEGQFRMRREPSVARVGEIDRVRPDRLVKLLADLPENDVTRLSVGRMRAPHVDGDQEFINVSELGGFLVSGGCATIEILRRFGPGTYRVSAYGFDPAGIRWEVIVEGLRDE
ncbi:MAG: helix-turn-helix transcriptional regulator [Proteobacteria bacterium]|nr:helix-turn-helix transcriptional regulator [Pseudomonadota bacterium]